jgi:hypothetical protein
MEEEGVLTQIRRELIQIEKEHPEVFHRIKELPSRVKTSKKAEKYSLLVCRRKSLGFFVSMLEDGPESMPRISLFEECLPLIRCEFNEPREAFSSVFWSNYQKVKDFSEALRAGTSDNSLEIKALSNLQSAQRHFLMELEEDLPFLRTLIRDLRDFRTLSKFTLRRFAELEIQPGKEKELKKLKKELSALRVNLGEDYLEEIERKLGSLKSEIVVAFENHKEEQN